MHDFTGWLLDEARDALQSAADTKDLPLRIVTTEPPQRPGGKSQALGEQKHPTQPGAARVLRCRIIRAAPAENAAGEAAGAGDPVIELLIAREQIALVDL